MDKTLIILGAGASKDFCSIFPTGLELIKDINYHFFNEKNEKGDYLSSLMNQIAAEFKHDEKLFRQIKKQLWRSQLDYEWCSMRNRTVNISIDNFINAQITKGTLDAKAGDIVKYSIYYLIKGVEQAYAERGDDDKKNWMKILSEKLAKFDFDDISENLKVLTLNYDRTFELYFTKYLGLSSEQAVFFRKNNVKHLYGCLGHLDEIPFCLENDKVKTFKDKYKRIKLIDDRNEMELPITDTETYRKVHFLGFGYDETNLKLINLNQFPSASLAGTAYNFSLPHIKQLKEKYNINIEDEKTTCIDYVSNLNI